MTPVALGAPVAAPLDVSRRASLEDLLPVLVRRVAWSSSGGGGCARLELGAGSLAGAVIVVRADAAGVRVKLMGPPGMDLGPWRERIAARLVSRLGDDVEVD